MAQKKKTGTKEKLIEEFEELFVQLVDFLAHWHRGVGGGTGYYRTLDSYKDKFKQLISKTQQATIEEIDPTDLIVPCNINCTPEGHAYHQGTWDAHLKLQKILDKLKKEGE